MSTFKHSKKDVCKWMERVHAELQDPSAQIKAAQQLFVLCKDEASTGILVQAGAVRTIVAALQEHLDDEDVLKATVVVLHRLIERGGAPAAKSALSAGAVEDLCYAMQMHPHNMSVQGGVATVFRILVIKGGAKAAKAAAAADVVEILSGIKSKHDANAQYQASKAIETIKKAQPKRRPSKKKTLEVHHSDEEDSVLPPEYDDSEDEDDLPPWRSGSKQSNGSLTLRSGSKQRNLSDDLSAADVHDFNGGYRDTERLIDHTNLPAGCDNPDERTGTPCGRRGCSVLHDLRSGSKGKNEPPSLGIWANKWNMSVDTLTESRELFMKFARLPHVQEDEDMLRDGILHGDDMMKLVCQMTGVRSLDELPREAEESMRLAVRNLGKACRLDFYEFSTWYDNRAFQECMNLSKSDMNIRDVGHKLGLSASDMDFYKTLFDKYDVNGSGEIDFEEFTSMMNICMKVPSDGDLNLPADRVKHWWSECDADGNHEINLTEFVEFYIKHFDPNAEDPLEDYYMQLRRV